MHAVVASATGGPEVLSWESLSDPTPGPGELLLQVEATSVNRADLLQREGHYPPPPGVTGILGLEAAGRVVGAGEGACIPEGPVCALLPGGGYAERVVVDARHVLPVPAAVGLPAAGALLEVALTAYLNLVELGGLQAGERVLIHGGSGGVGHVALQLAQHLGAEVWTTASSAKLARCRELGAQVACDYRDDDWSERVREAGGADVILDCIGAGYLDANLGALAPHGRLVVIGLQRGRRAEIDLGRLLARRLTLIGSTLRGLDAARKGAVIERFRQRVWPLFDQGQLQLVVDREFALPQAGAAHEALAGGGVFGKVLLRVPVA